MLENYFGLIEALFVFSLAIAFYVWQMRDLRKYDRKDVAPSKEEIGEKDKP